MNRRALELLIAPMARVTYAPVDDARALEKVVEILARLVKQQETKP